MGSHIHIFCLLCFLLLLFSFLYKIVNEHFVFHYTAEREAVNAAERAERKQHLREKVGVNFFVPFLN